LFVFCTANLKLSPAPAVPHKSKTVPHKLKIYANFWTSPSP
jgi:hypothetical protein